MYRFASSASVRGTDDARRSPPSRCSTLTMSGSTVASPPTSRSASATRPRTPAPHVSVVATSAAIAPATSTTRRCERVSASIAIATVHTTRYQVGNDPGASQHRRRDRGHDRREHAARPMARSPRRGPSPALPTAASAMNSVATARKSAISHPSQSSTATPPGGGETPAPSVRSKRRRRGENRDRDRHRDPPRGVCGVRGAATGGARAARSSRRRRARRPTR